MSDKEENGVRDDEEIGPGMAYQPFIIMEELSDKLKLLNYEQDYCIKRGNKPISRLLLNIVKTNIFFSNIESFNES